MSRLEARLDAEYGEIEARGIYIAAEFVEEEGGIEVFTGITARGRGDEALQLLAEKLQNLADQHKVPFVHIGCPTNQAAKRLFARTPGYNLGSDEHAWIKPFLPRSQS